MKISLCIITLNEQDNLRRCLESALPIADEIVVVDSGSIDGTKEIAREFSAVWEHRDWEGYVNQKNYALSRASHEWVLSLDADESLSERLLSELLCFKTEKKIPSECAGFSMPRCVCYEGRWIRNGDWYPDRLVRLFKKSESIFIGDKVHERLYLEGEVGPLNGEIEHYSFKSAEDHKNRMDHYSKLWAESQYENGNQPGILSEYTHAFWSFIRGFFLRTGFMDGRVGWAIAITNASAVYLKYSRLRAMWKARYDSGSN